MHTINHKRAIQAILWVALFVFVACEKHEEISGVPLVTIGDRVITRDDFIRRAEYTVRPAYASGQTYIHKKIILNTLIAEKLMALEADREGTSLDTNQAFQRYLAGRQEQVMRQVLFQQEAHEKTTVDSSEQQRAFRLAGKEYHLEYYSLPDTAAARSFVAAIKDGIGFGEIFRALYRLDSLPTRSINWLDREDELIRNLVFEEDHEQGSVIGPLETGDGSILVMRVAGWTNRPAISENDITQRWQDVGERLHESAARSRYQAFVADIMRGRQMEFNAAVFMPYAQAAADYYLSSAEEKKSALATAIWNLEENLDIDPGAEYPEVQKQERLFTMDGVTWTVEDFEKHLQRHPLVFRKRQMSRTEFPEQFRLAIADMLRDHVVTQYAYDQELDQLPEVQQSRALWSDYYAAKQVRGRVFKESGVSLADSLTQAAVFKKILNPFVDSLQAAYHDEIQINMDLFEDIDITSVPMMVSQRGVPFPLMVPAFPILTDDNRIDYGSLMEP